jgi:hypothetical protein
MRGGDPIHLPLGHELVPDLPLVAKRRVARRRRGWRPDRETEAGPGRELQVRISQLSLLCPFFQSAQEFGFIIGEGSCAGEACDAPAADPRRCRRLLGSFSGSVARGGHSYLALRVGLGTPGSSSTSWRIGFPLSASWAAISKAINLPVQNPASRIGPCGGYP